MKKLFKGQLKKRVYLALAAAVFLVLNETSVIHITEADYNTYVNLIATVLTAVGILAVPTKEAK